MAKSPIGNRQNVYFIELLNIRISQLFPARRRRWVRHHHPSCRTAGSVGPTCGGAHQYRGANTLNWGITFARICFFHALRAIANSRVGFSGFCDTISILGFCGTILTKSQSGIFSSGSSLKARRASALRDFLVFVSVSHQLTPYLLRQYARTFLRLVADIVIVG